MPYISRYVRAIFCQMQSTCRQVRREPQRGPGNHYRGSLSLPHYVCDEIETPKASRVSSHNLTRGLGERRKLPQRGPGRSPAENGFYAYLRSERSHLELFRIWVIRDTRFVENLFMNTSCELHQGDLIMMTSPAFWTQLVQYLPSCIPSQLAGVKQHCVLREKWTSLSSRLF